MIAKGLHDDCLRPAPPIEADRPGPISRDGITRPARVGPVSVGRTAGTAARTRAVRRLGRAIGAAAMNPMPQGRIPAHAVALLTRMRRTDRALRADLGRAPTFEEVAGAQGLSESQKAMVVRTLRSLSARRPASGAREDGRVLLMEAIGRPEARDGRGE